MKANSPEAYLSDLLIAVPRLLSLENRNPISRTFGCFDRAHWQYAVVDTPSARCQEAALTLTLLYQAEGPDTPWRQNPIALEWIQGALGFWRGIQAGDGSFSEWYPNESSYVATAFTTYAVTEVIHRLRGQAADAAPVVDSAAQAGEWLIRHRERRVANQEAGAAAALWSLARLTDDRRFQREAIRKIEGLAKEQTEEGWFPEYGGPDIGYLSQLVAYLAKLYTMEPREDVHDIATKAISFLLHFAHPDGSFGGEYASRETGYFIPDAVETFAPTIPAAAALARRARAAIAAGTIPSPRSLDDRYLTYTGYEYLFAYLHAGPLPDQDQVTLPEFSRFPQAGLAVVRKAGLHLVVNGLKGGSLACHWLPSGRCLLDPGVAAKHGNSYWKSAWLSSDRRWSATAQQMVTEGRLVRDRTGRISPASNVMLRLWQLSIGRSSRLSLWLKGALRTKLVSGAEAGPYRHLREIVIHGSDLEVTDRIIGPPPSEIVLSPTLSSLYVPSSRFYLPAEASQAVLRFGPDSWRTAGRRPTTIVVRRRYSHTGALLDLRVTGEP